jgi:hypothetical protein
MPVLTQKTESPNHFQSFKEFWPFYVSQHLNPVCRTLHYMGTSLGITALAYSVYSNQAFWTFFLCPIPAYAFAWIGHFLFEKNRPATFRYPRWSFLADFVMLYYFLTGKIGAEMEKSEVQTFARLK